MKDYATTKEIRKINKDLRAKDDSHLWPICSRFNATDRAINRVRRFMRDYGAMTPLEYQYAIEHEISKIVNGVR